MQTNFEKQVKQRLHDFGLEPSDHVWDDISNALDTPKRRRVVAWWVCAAGSVLLVAGLWFAGNKLFPVTNNPYEKSLVSINHSAPVPHLNENITAKQNDAVANSLTQNNFSAQKNSVPNKILQSSNNNSNTIAADANPSSSLSGKQITSVNGSNTLQSISRNKPDPSYLQNGYNEGTAKQPAENIIQASPQIENGKTSTENKSAEIALQKNNPSPQTATAAAVPPKANKTKRSMWSFLFGGGSTNTINENFLFAKSNPLVYSNNSGARDTVKSMRPAYPGFHITGGIQYSFALTSHWTLYSGLQYSFLLNHQRTGKEVTQETQISSAADTLNPVPQQYFKISSHYVDGTSSLNTNYASWLEVPVSFGYKINPRSKVNVELRAGASLTHMFADKWLIPDGRYNKFYYSNELTNNYIVNMHEDIVVNLPKHKIIGLQFQHSITSLAKSAVQPALYWSNISLYTTIPIK